MADFLISRQGKYDCGICRKRMNVGDKITQLKGIWQHYECSKPAVVKEHPTTTAGSNSKGTCSLCNKSIKGGEIIIKVDSKWDHEECFKILCGNPQNGNPPSAPSAPSATSAPTVPITIDSKWNAEQRAIIEAYINTKDNLLVESGPGVGKTTILFELFRHCRVTPLYLVFNNSMQEEAQHKADTSNTNVKIYNFHKLGNYILRSNGFKYTIDPDKVGKIIKSKFSGFNKKERNLLKKLVSLYKNTLNRNLNDLINQYDVEVSDKEESIITEHNFNLIIEASDSNTNFMDLDDLVYFPAKFNLTARLSDHIFVDECQDLNTVQRLLLMNHNKGRRFIFVGDSDQAIYAFRGADSNSTKLIKQEFNCKELSQTITYRFPKAIVDYVNSKNLSEKKITSGIPDKAVNIVHLTNEFPLNEVNDNDLILCPLNAPIISTAFQLIRLGKKPEVLGKSFWENIENFLDNIIMQNNVTNMDQYYEALNKYLDEERTRLQSKYKDNEDKFETMYALSRDKVECLIEMAEGLNSIPEITTRLSLIKNMKGSIKLSTIHKAKGLEAPKVWIIHYEKFKLFQNSQGKEMEWVALTRTKGDLTIITYRKERE